MSSATVERRVRDFQCYGLEIRAFLFYEREIEKYFDKYEEPPTAADLEVIEARREAWEAQVVDRYRALLEKREAEQRQRMQLWRERKAKHAA